MKEALLIAIAVLLFLFYRETANELKVIREELQSIHIANSDSVKKDNWADFIK